MLTFSVCFLGIVGMLKNKGIEIPLPLFLMTIVGDIVITHIIWK